jgi:hypothetical protein
MLQEIPRRNAEGATPARNRRPPQTAKVRQRPTKHSIQSHSQYSSSREPPQTGNAQDPRWLIQRLDVVCASWAEAWSYSVQLLQETSHREEVHAGDLVRDLMRTLGRAGEEVHHLRGEVAVAL